MIEAALHYLNSCWISFMRWLSVGQVDSLPGLLRIYWMTFRNSLLHGCARLASVSMTLTAFRLLKICGGFVIVVFCLLIVALLALSIPDQSIAAHQPVSRVIFTDQGWGTSVLSERRQSYYYTPQGTSLKNLRYSWFINLEQAWKTSRLADPENMSRLGFIVDDVKTSLNPERLPVGFTRHFVPALNDRVIDITCAACHTGQMDVTALNGEHVGIRIDGGQAMHAFTSLSAGQFGPSLVTSMMATAINPLKFHRFAKRVVSPDLEFSAELALYRDFWSVLYPLSAQAFSDIRRHLYPVTEGYGRLDAIGRIANHVFADELDTKNYRVANAPVSYPAVWDIWKFDWVQYTASVAQPLARNLGETLGVGADLSLCDRYDRPLAQEDRYVSSAIIPNLVSVEDELQALKPPVWPEEILGKINQTKANLGRGLFQLHCARCHQPCEMNEEDRAVLVPDKKQDQPHWHLNALPLSVIGTDPTSAENFVNNRYDLSKTGLTVEEVRAELRKSWMARENRINHFRTSHGSAAIDTTDFIQNQLSQVNIQSASVGAGLNYVGMFLRQKYYLQNQNSTNVNPKQYNGFDALDLPEVKLQYKARPLGGVWATAPYLHNGSVPTLYELLLPADKRRKRFFSGRREFDKVRVGLLAEPLTKDGFWLDTSIHGNWNIGHEFRSGFTGRPANGVIGPELLEKERWAIIEYLKIHRDDPAPACTYTYSEPPSPGSTKW